MGQLLPPFWAFAYPRFENEQIAQELYHHQRMLTENRYSVRQADSQDALNIFTPRQLRLAFMCVPWHGPMNYEEKKTLAEATKIEADFDVS